MKKIFGIFSFLVFHICLPAEDVLPLEVYKSYAEKYLKNIEDVQEKSCDLGRTALIYYLNDRIVNAQKLLSENNSNDNEFKLLNQQYVSFFCLNYLDTDPNVRSIYYYASMVNELLAFTLRKKLGCYVESLQDFEMQYGKRLEQVNSEEFSHRMGIFSSRDLDMLLLKNSEQFVQAIFTSINL